MGRQSNGEKQDLICNLGNHNRNLSGSRFKNTLENRTRNLVNNFLVFLLNGLIWGQFMGHSEGERWRIAEKNMYLRSHGSGTEPCLFCPEDVS